MTPETCICDTPPIEREPTKSPLVGWACLAREGGGGLVREQLLVLVLVVLVRVVLVLAVRELMVRERVVTPAVRERVVP